MTPRWGLRKFAWRGVEETCRTSGTQGGTSLRDLRYLLLKRFWFLIPVRVFRVVRGDLRLRFGFVFWLPFGLIPCP